MSDNKSAVATPIPEEFKLLHRYWQASNYLSVGQVRYVCIIWTRMTVTLAGFHFREVHNSRVLEYPVLLRNKAVRNM